jgi:hypothetical protein
MNLVSNEKGFVEKNMLELISTDLVSSVPMLLVVIRGTLTEVYRVQSNTENGSDLHGVVATGSLTPMASSSPTSSHSQSLCTDCTSTSAPPSVRGPYQTLRCAHPHPLSDRASAQDNHPIPKANPNSRNPSQSTIVRPNNGI